jgi:transcriptional regulator with XRE-family HTH domain
MASSKKKIGEIIKRARTRKNLTADAVGEECNVSRSRVYQWEAASFIMPKNLPALARALGLSERTLKRANGGRDLEPA